MLCISVPVHQNLEVIKDLIENFNRRFPPSWIVLHLSFSGFELRPALRTLIKSYDNVLLNPLSCPTDWGWMFHAHLANFHWIKSIGLAFDHFVLEASNSLYVRNVNEHYLTSHDFLAEVLDLDTLTTSSWSWGPQQSADVAFHNLKRELGIKKEYMSTPEGMVFERNLFVKMIEVIDRHYIFDFHEVRYPRECLYFQTLARHFSSRYSSPLTTMIWNEHDFETKKARILELRESAEFVPVTATAQPLSSSDTSGYFGKHFFGVKPVPRDIADPVRIFIASLP